jgi:hypothetical protein
MSFSCRLVDDSNHKSGDRNPLVSLQDIEEQQQQQNHHDHDHDDQEEGHDCRSCLSECDSWDDDEDDHHEKHEDHGEGEDDDDDDDKDQNSLPQSSLRRGQSNGPMYLLQDPIVIGYAFGPKKMSTMGVVMAEASKAKVTTTATTPIAATLAAGTKRTVPSASLSFQKIPDENHTVATSASSVASSAIASASTPGTATTLLTWDALNSMMEPITQTIFSIGSQEDCYGNDGLASNTTTTNDLKHIVRYFQSSCSSAASATETTISTKTTLSAKTSSWTVNGRPQQHQHPYHQYPIRLSFVPLDPNISLEEQQGGKFDLILHKLTEDILECSLLETNMNNSDQDRPPPPQELSQPQQHVYENNSSSRSKSNENESFQRVERLQNYQRDHPECCMVDDPSHVQTLMSRSEIGHVLQQCLQGVTSSSGIPVCAPKFVECRLPPVAPSFLSSRTVTTICPTSPSGHVDSAATSSNTETTTTAQLVQTLADRLQEEQMHSFPLIAKPLMAAGTKQSHSMAVLLNSDALPLFLQHKVDQQQQQQQQTIQHQQQAQQQQQHNFVLQEYVNHNALLYKVYVLGDTVKVYQRPSLPNLPISEVQRRTIGAHMNHSDKTDSSLVNAKKGVFVEFDSQRPYPRLQDFGINAVPSAAPTTSTTATVTTDATTAAPHVNAKTPTLLGGAAAAPTAVTEAEVLPIVNALKQAFGLELFGFDILVTVQEENQNADLTCDAITKTTVEEDGQPVDSGKDTTVRMLVVDVNYFPSYKEVPNFPSLLAHYLTQRVLQSREQQQLPKQQQSPQQTQDGE